MAGNLDSIDRVRVIRQELTKMAAGGAMEMTSDSSCALLRNYFDFLEQQLSDAGAIPDVSQIQEMLLEVSEFIRSGKTGYYSDEYGRILKRLVSIYAGGFSSSSSSAFTLTSANYADVVEAISNRFPGYDYTEAMGQLLAYMEQLFANRKSDWKTIYEHIISMPESVEAKRLIKAARFEEVRQWAEEGAGNLFGIRVDLLEVIGQLSAEIDQLNADIEHLGRAWRTGRVVSLAARRKANEVPALIEARERVIHQRMDKQNLVELIESNIEEFEMLLRSARRAFFFHIV